MVSIAKYSGLVSSVVAIGLLAPVAPASGDDTYAFYFTSNGTFYFREKAKYGDILIIKVTGEDVQLGSAQRSCWSGYLFDREEPSYYGGSYPPRGRFERGYIRLRTTPPVGYVHDVKFDYQREGYGSWEWSSPWYRPISRWQAKYKLRKLYGIKGMWRLFSDCVTWE